MDNTNIDEVARIQKTQFDFHPSLVEHNDSSATKIVNGIAGESAREHTVKARSHEVD